MLLDLIERFQTSLVGILGFTGVILTMVVNARTQRTLQATQRDNQARSLRTALLVELKENVRIYEDRVRDLSNMDGSHDALLPSKVINNIFQTSLPNIGLISARDVESVLLAYLLLDEMPYRLRLLVGTDQVGGYKSEFIRIDATQQNAAKRIYEALLPTLHKAVTALESNA